MEGNPGGTVYCALVQAIRGGGPTKWGAFKENYGCMHSSLEMKESLAKAQPWRPVLDPGLTPMDACTTALK